MLPIKLTKTFQEIKDGDIFSCSILLGGMETYTDVSFDLIPENGNIDETFFYLRVSKKVLLKMQLKEILAIAKTPTAYCNVFVQAYNTVINILQDKHSSK